MRPGTYDRAKYGLTGSKKKRTKRTTTKKTGKKKTK